MYDRYVIRDRSRFFHWIMSYHVIVRPTKIINYLRKDWKMTFKVIFIVENQWNLSDFFEEYYTRRATVNIENFWKICLPNILYFLKMYPIFIDSVRNFGRSDIDTI